MKYQKTKPCPFCGHKKTMALRHPFIYDEFLVQCCECVAHGGHFKRKIDAIKRWNEICEIVMKGKAK